VGISNSVIALCGVIRPNLCCLVNQMSGPGQRRY
jgi:hypothetical protein